jgi:hypothetical protein
MKILRIVITALALMFCALLFWLFANRLLFYRATVLELPIQFEPGFSLTHEFSVDIERTYWVAIRYNEIFRSTVEIPSPLDEFAAEFEVRSKNKVVAKGSTTSLPDGRWGGPAPWATARDHVTRYLGSFEAQPRTAYSLSLQITNAQPRLTSKAARAIVTIDWRFDEFRGLRESLLVWTGVGIGIATLLVYSPVLLHWKRERQRG